MVLLLHNLRLTLSTAGKKKAIFKFFIWWNSYTETLVRKEYEKENQTKIIKYIDLDKYHSKNKPSEKSKKELYERNKNIFFTEFKTIRYAEITPQKITEIISTMKVF